MTSRFGDELWSSPLSNYLTGHDKKINFVKTDHQIEWSGWSWADHDQTGHNSLKTLEAIIKKMIQK
jgi:hypothetical protein